MSSPNGLNVIALVSGGKDSLYSILHCIRNGHKVVALANLYPKQTKTSAPDGSGVQEDHGDEEEDIDSFMYQTIGHSVVPLYETALQIPLYRGVISGGAVDTARVYGNASTANNSGNQNESLGEGEGDETESLIPLLRKVKEAHPEANAVSAGAILSTYQRTRIEDVAARLHLVPLAWLWQYPILPPPAERRDASALSTNVADAGLLEDMAAINCSARIIKVASGGLDESFLWEDVSSTSSATRGRIIKAMRRFAEADAGGVRGAVLGEGGEYESLAVDGPSFLWKRRIEVLGREVRAGEGGVGFLGLRGAKCADKESDDEVKPGNVRRPGILDEEFDALLDGLSFAAEEEREAPVAGASKQWHCEPVQTSNGGLWTISNLSAPEAGPDAGKQMSAIAAKVQSILSSTSDRSTDDIVFATVLLRSMTDFTSMNNIYVSLFKKPNPPARATVACGNALPGGVNIMVSYVVDLGPRDARQGLHVQSRSYWAPANIGPYSQAISVQVPAPASDQESSKLVYIAGQIPLEPANMEMITWEALSQHKQIQQSWVAEYALRAVLALQHLWRIGAAMQVDWWVGGIAFLTGDDDYGNKNHIPTKARLAWETWAKMHMRPEENDEEDDDDEPTLDAWDLKYGRREYAYEQTSSTKSAPGLPNFDILQKPDPTDTNTNTNTNTATTTIPPFLAAQISGLPRASDVEWQGLGCVCKDVAVMTDKSVSDIGVGVDTSTTTVDKRLDYTCIEIGEGSESDLESSLQEILRVYSQGQGKEHMVLYTAKVLEEGFVWPGQIIPCLSVWGREGRRLKGGVIIQKCS
ncbi:diphthine--ammonia ligase family protein [Aspergillus ruber CBS 135680]|uniref:Diphthine--ammonia ligase n=1 Tax=Aspergillus ruber (strain CBS 135680) TaxID=1388766 RepID=A0A017S6J5_ASPRC|nr:adenine nucleotide alpha hydrolases-like protein [Aspergillus ruber CBS 135680]EYE92249.1 adenine nucleotide alpha hydrolases-like protein [Aspergillus ruber CBS 135680]